MQPDLSQVSQFRAVLEQFIQKTALDAVIPTNTLRAQQVQSPVNAQVVGTVLSYVSPKVTVQFPDGSTGDFQVGNRWLSVGDLTTVFGGVAH